MKHKTAEQWDAWWQVQPWSNLKEESSWLDIIADFAACEKERDEWKASHAQAKGACESCKHDLGEAIDRAEAAEEDVRQLTEAVRGRTRVS